MLPQQNQGLMKNWLNDKEAIGWLLEAEWVPYSTLFSDYKERDWKYIIHKYIDVPRFVIWMNVVEKIAECLEQWVQMHRIQNSTRSDQARSTMTVRFWISAWLHLLFKFIITYFKSVMFLLWILVSRVYSFLIFTEFQFWCSTTNIDWYYQILSK